MKRDLEYKILEFSARLKTAIAQNNHDLVNACTSIIAGFRILLRMQDGPEVCAFPPSYFNESHDG